MTEERIALLCGREIGRVRRSNRGRVTFAYDGAGGNPTRLSD